ncbi:MAG: CDP-alcohol phosphatidyltransferase family protein [Chitinophagales bacterium]
MTAVIRFIPNAITLLNAFSGALAVLYIANGKLLVGAYFIALGAFFDFFDGLAARALKVNSPVGKDLDSLADMITFGLAPAFLAHKLLLISLGEFAEEFDPWLYLQYIPFIAVMFTAFRLAKFNHDDRQSHCFYGLASPAHALFWISIPLSIHYSDQNWLLSWLYERFQYDMTVLFFQPQIIIALSIFLSVLMVLDLPLFALKFEGFSWKGNELKISFLIISLLLLATIGFVAVPLILLLYVLMSLLHYKVFSRGVVKQ